MFLHPFLPWSHSTACQNTQESGLNFRYGPVYTCAVVLILYHASETQPAFQHNPQEVFVWVLYATATAKVSTTCLIWMHWLWTYQHLHLAQHFQHLCAYNFLHYWETLIMLLMHIQDTVSWFKLKSCVRTIKVLHRICNVFTSSRNNQRSCSAWIIFVNVRTYLHFLQRTSNTLNTVKPLFYSFEGTTLK
jgi:hypothetical protein